MRWLYTLYAMVVYAVVVYAWLCTCGCVRVVYARDSFYTELRARLPLSRWRAVRTDDCMGDSRAVSWSCLYRR